MTASKVQFTRVQCVPCLALLLCLALGSFLRPAACSPAEQHHSSASTGNSSSSSTSTSTTSNNGEIRATAGVATTAAPGHAGAAGALHHKLSVSADASSAGSLPSLKPSAPPNLTGTALHSKGLAAGAAVATATLKPAGTSTKAPQVVTAAAGASVGAAHRLAAYFEPVCAELDKLQPKQMFKVQGQLKQFIEKTAGKMSLCFLQHYSVDPNLTPVNKAQLGTICASRKLAADAAGAFSKFQACAEQNWDKSLDAELERINRLRENCVQNHAHAKTDPTAKLSHDDEVSVQEATVITDVLGKVFDGNQAAVNKTDIKMVEVRPTAAAAATAVTGSGAAAATKTTSANATTTATGPAKAAIATAGSGVAASTSSQLPSKQILNDPNTMVVFVDEPAKTTLAPAVVVAPATTSVASAQPTAAASLSASAGPAVALHHGNGTVAAAAGGLATSVAPTASALGALLATPVPAHAASAPTASAAAAAAGGTATAGATSAKPAVATTLKPSLVVATTPAAVKVSGHLGLGDKILRALDKIESPHFGSKAAGVNVTTSAKPSASVSTAGRAAATSVVSTTTTGAPKKSPSSSAPASTSAPAPASSAKPRASADAKSKLSKAEADAKSAIKSLQLQRALQSNGVSDAHMHQIEHQRQMAIDPVGHTIKHQQYEQRKAAAAAAAQAGSKKAQ